MSSMFNKELVRKFINRKTPFYYYDLELLDRTLESVKKYGQDKGYHIHFALKANNNDRILKNILAAGLGADCVSGKEIEKAIEIGFQPGQIAFAGVGKTDEEIEIGLEHDIFSFNCESVQEVELLNRLASVHNKTARIALRINPNIKAKTHKYIATGAEENKFGILVKELPELADKIRRFENLELTGIHFHIGSQIEDLNSFDALCNKINQLQSMFDEKEIRLQHINVGGGFGIDYSDPDENAIPDFKTYFQTFDKNLKLRDNQKLHFELGRSIVGQCGSLISKVLFIKEGYHTRFAVVDAGMTELIRPALYQAKHQINHLDNLNPSSDEILLYDVVGPICETSDTFRTGYPMPELRRGDLVAIRSCGAYGQVMSSDYNLRERAKVFYSDDFE